MSRADAICGRQDLRDVTVSLAFCYANRVSQPPDAYLEADYRCVELFKIAGGQTFTQALLQSCTTFDLPCQPEQELFSQTQTERQAFWHSSPYSSF